MIWSICSIMGTTRWCSTIIEHTRASRIMTDHSTNLGNWVMRSVLNGAVRPSWSWTAVDGVQPSRPVLSKGCPAPHGQGQFPRRSPAVRQGMKWLGPLQVSFMLRNTPELVNNLTPVRDCLCHSNFPQCLDVRIQECSYSRNPSASIW